MFRSSAATGRAGARPQERVRVATSSTTLRVRDSQLNPPGSPQLPAYLHFPTHHHHLSQLLSVSLSIARAIRPWPLLYWVNELGAALIQVRPKEIFLPCGRQLILRHQLRKYLYHGPNAKRAQIFLMTKITIPSTSRDRAIKSKMTKTIQRAWTLTPTSYPPNQHQSNTSLSIDALHLLP